MAVLISGIKLNISSVGTKMPAWIPVIPVKIPEIIPIQINCKSIFFKIKVIYFFFISCGQRHGYTNCKGRECNPYMYK